MDEQTSYLNFLKNFLNEEIYIVKESEHQLEKPEETADIENENTSEHTEEIENLSLTFTGNPATQIALIIDRSLAGDVNERFNKMIENLGLKLNDCILVNLQQQDRKENLLNRILDLSTTKLIFFGGSDLLTDVNEAQEFNTITINGKKILLLPSFQDIIQDKKSVLNSWEILKNFIGE